MRNKQLLRLVLGFKRFRNRYFLEQPGLYSKLSSGQSSKTLIIGCSDSRVDPAIITEAAPGELFVVRNVANLVPPFEGTNGFHGVSSAIEFAVVNLKVENIIVLGHRQCGGIRTLMTKEGTSAGSFVGHWMQIAQTAKENIEERYFDEPLESRIRRCEMESIAISIKNLRSFPFVEEAIKSRSMAIIGAYFDLEQGDLLEYDEESASFHQISLGTNS